MARKQRSVKKLRDSIPCFVVEGCTEKNYLDVLKSIYSIRIDIKNTEGGNANGVMKKALSIFENNPEYTKFIVWFDNDKFFKKDNNILQKLKSKNVIIVQSYPCIESWLLAHFKQIFDTQLSKNYIDFEKELKDKYIKDYHKNNCNQLKEYIKIEVIDEAKNNYPKYIDNIEFIFEVFNAN